MRAAAPGLIFASPAPPVGQRMTQFAAKVIDAARRASTAAFIRRLSFPEASLLCLILLAIGAVYCQIYCLLALQQMHGATMPLGASLGRVGADIVPAFAAFELAKRVRFERPAQRWAAFTAIFLSALALAFALRMQVHMMSSMISPRRMAVDRLPSLVLAAAALAYFDRRRRIPAALARRAQDPIDPEPIPMPKAVDWVRAARNYVEIRVCGHTRLVRMTLRDAAAYLPDSQFVQIHRSVIVNRQRISTVRGGRTVAMADGTEFKVGDAYRSKLLEI